MSFSNTLRSAPSTFSANYVSSEKRLKNDLQNLEEQSTIKISPNHYYLVSLVLEKDLAALVDTDKVATKINKFIKDTLASSDRPALAVYHFENTLIILYNLVNNVVQEENLDTSEDQPTHQEILSDLVSTVALLFQSKVKAKIIELDAKIKVVSYFQYVVSDNTKSTLLQIANGKITPEDLETYTWEELLRKVKVKKTWEATSSEKKFGKFYKLSNKKLLTLSENINFALLEKYLAYFFETN